MNATPGPRVSGKNFFPNAPLLCAKRMPDCLVTSRNVTVEATGALLLSPATATATASTNAAPKAVSPLIVSSLLIAADAQSVRHAIDVIEPGRDQRNLQNTAVVEADGPELSVIVRRNFGGILGQLHNVIEHGAILFADRGGAVIPL